MLAYAPITTAGVNADLARGLGEDTLAGQLLLGKPFLDVVVVLFLQLRR